MAVYPEIENGGKPILGYTGGYTQTLEQPGIGRKRKDEQKRQSPDFSGLFGLQWLSAAHQRRADGGVSGIEKLPADLCHQRVSSITNPIGYDLGYMIYDLTLSSNISLRNTLVQPVSEVTAAKNAIIRSYLFTTQEFSVIAPPCSLAVVHGHLFDCRIVGRRCTAQFTLCCVSKRLNSPNTARKLRAPHLQLH